MPVVFLKNKVENDPYAALFPDAVFVPVLEHKLIVPDQLTDWLYEPGVKNAEALIITSQRAVEALSHVPKPLLEKLVLHKPVFTVGPATAAYLREVGFTDVRGESTGNSTVLVDEVLAQEKFHSYVFFTGSTRRDYIPRSLDEMGKVLVEKVVYRTGPRKNVFPELQSKLQGGDLRHSWLVFFSPSGADPVVEGLCGTKLKEWQLAAIGPTTETYLQMNGLPPKAVAKLPTPRDLLEAISEASKTTKPLA